MNPSVRLPRRRPLISVVTPSFNQARYLEACIVSVLSQSYPEVEYIVMDGGSGDGSVGIIRRHAGRIAHWRTGPDDGQYAAVEAGFSMASGDILTWLNADDMFHPDAFAVAAAVFTAHPEIRWLTGRGNTFAADGCQDSILEVLIPFSRRRFLEGGWGAPCLQQEGTFWRRDLWEESGARMARDLDLAGDLELWIRFFRHAPVHVVDALLAGYRRQPEAKTARHMDRYIREGREIIENERDRLGRGRFPVLPPAPPPLTADDVRAALRRSGLTPLVDPRWRIAPTPMGGAARAVAFYTEVAARRPERGAEAHNSLGLLAFEAGRHAEAVRHFTRALRIDPRLNKAFLNLEDLLQRMGHDTPARRLREVFDETTPAGTSTGTRLSLPKVDSDPHSGAVGHR